MATISAGELEAVLKLRDELSANVQKMLPVLDKLDSALGVVDKSSEEVEKGLKGIGDVAAGVALGNWITQLPGMLMDLGKQAIQSAGEFEQTRVAFTTMLGSATAADAFLNQLKDFAAKTPFEFKELVGSAKSMKALGFETSQIIPMMTNLGNASAALGGGADLIARLTNQIGQMQAKGKVSAEEMRVMAQSGIPVWDMLAKKIGTDVPTAMAKAAKGAIDARTGIDALMEGMQQRYGGMMEAQSATFLGKMSTLKDNLNFIIMDFGSALLPTVGRVVDAFAEFLPTIQSAMPAVQDFIGALVEVAMDLEPLVTVIGGILLNIFGAFAEAIYNVTGGTVDFKIALENLDLAGDAVRLLWLALKNGAVDLALAFDKARQSMAIISGDDALAMSLEKDIKTLEGFKKEYMDATEKVIAGSDKQKKAVATLPPEIKKTTDTHKGLTAEAQKQADAFAKLVKAYKDQHTELGRTAAAQKEVNVIMAATGGVMKMTQKDILDAVAALKKFGPAGQEAGQKLREEWEKAHQTVLLVGREIKLTVPALDAVKKTAEEEGMAFVRAEQEKYNKTFETNSAIAKQAAALYATGQISGVVYDKILKDLDVLPDKTQKATKATFDWSKGLQAVHDAFELMGVKADSTLGKLVTSLTATLAITQDIAKLFENGKGFGDLSSAQKGQVAIAGLNTAMVAYKSGALGGAAAGAIYGASLFAFTGVGAIAGAAIGAVVGGIIGFIGQRKRMHEAMKEMIDDFKKSHGGMSQLAVDAMKAGVSLDAMFKAKNPQQLAAALDQIGLAIGKMQFVEAQGGIDALRAKAIAAGADLDKMLNAQNVEAYNAALKELQDRLMLHDEAWKKLDDAAKRYGFTIDELGPKFAAQQLDPQMMQIYEDWHLLTAAGVDHEAILNRLGPEVGKLVDQYVLGGAEIPKAMKPIIDELYEHHKLLHENGEEYTEAEYKALTYGSTTSEMFKELIAKVDELIKALLGIPDTESTHTTHYKTTGRPPGNLGNTEGEGDDGSGNENENRNQRASGMDALITRRTDFTAGESGRERVTVTPEGRPMPGSQSDEALLRELRGLRSDFATMPMVMKIAIRDAKLLT